MIFNKYIKSYKKATTNLLIGCLLVLVAVYFLAISKTVALFEDNNILSSKLEQTEIGSSDMNYLKSQLEGLQERMVSYTLDSIKDKEYVMNVVSHFCVSHQLTLREFPKAVIDSENDFDLETILVVVQGDFINLLKLAYHLEQHNKAGRLSAVKFEKVFDHKLQRDYLIAKLYIQHLKITTNDQQ